MNTDSLLRISSRRLVVVWMLLLAAVWVPSTTSAAQNVPVPYASTVAGGGVVCANSISTYAPLAANQKLVGDGCPAAQSTFNTPVALGIDRFNNVVIADQTNNLVRVIYNGGADMAAAIIAANVQTTNLVPQVGYIYTIVGGPQGTPSQSTFYCTETGTGAIGFDKQLDGCPGAFAYVQPRGMAFDKDGNLFISSLASSYTVRVLYVSGTAIANLIALENPTLVGPPRPGYVYEIAGTGAPTNTTGGDGGLAYKASISQPRGLWIDSNENVYFADTLNGLIRRVDGATGLISTVAGNCVASPACPASASGGDGNPATGSAVKINYPYGVVFDGFGNMFIADSGSGTGLAGRIRVVYAGGTLPGISNPVVGNIYTYAGGGGTTGTQAQKTTFQFVEGVGIDANGYLYVNDFRNATSPGGNHMWRVDPSNGNIVNIAGSGGVAAQTAGGYCSNSTGTMSTDTRGDGCPGPQTYMNFPQQAPAFDSLGNFYVAERMTNVVRYFSYTNAFPSTPVGSSVTRPQAFALPSGTQAAPTAFLVNGAAATDFSDAGNDVCVGAGATPAEAVCVVNVKFSPSVGNVREGSMTATASSTVIAAEALVGVGSAGQLSIDPGTSVQLGAAIKPQGVSVDLLGNVYLSDGAGKQVLRTTLAGGAPTAMFTGLGSPQGTTTDSFGNVYVADTVNNNVLQRSLAGTVTTVVTGLSAPSGMAADGRGDVYVADTGNNRVMRYSPLSGVATPVNIYPQILSGPTALTMDAAGDLYILDSGNKRILKLPPAGLPQAIALPAGVVPAAFGLDHAGNLYLADTTSATLLVARATGSTETLQTGLVAPVGLAIDINGDIFLADSATTSVLGLKRTLSTDSFATTNVNAQSLPAALNLDSIGDVAATLGSAVYTETGNSADFPVATSGNTCSASLVLAAGASCTESFTFAPVATGARAATVTFTPTTGTAVSANLSGTAVNLVSTTLAITQTAPTTSTVSYGQSTTFLANLTASRSASTAPTGTVTFVVDGVKQTLQTVSSTGNTLTNNLSVGTHVIAAVYSGDSVYASSNSSFSLTVNKAVTTTTISSTQNVSGLTLTSVVTPAYTGALGMTGTVTFYVDNVAQTPQSIGTGTVTQVVSVADGTHAVYAVYSGDTDYAGSTSTTATITVSRIVTSTALVIAPSATTTTVSLQLTATVTGAGGTPSGTITFYNGTTKLSTVALSSGVASLTTATGSNYLFTATYSGDGLFQPSTVTVTETPDFAMLAPSANLVVPQGGQAVATISVVSVANYTGSMTATCSNLPINSLCRFSPVPLPVAPGVNGNLGVEVFVSTYAQTAGIGVVGDNLLLIRGLSMLSIGFSLFLLIRIRRHSSLACRLLSLLIVAALALTAVGCGQNNAASFQNTPYPTPAGIYPVTVNLTDANKITHSITLNVQVNSQ